MSQILLYLFLAGLAILLFAWTRPNVSHRSGTSNQPEILDLLQRFEQEQAGLTVTLQIRLNEIEQRIGELETQTLRMHEGSKTPSNENLNGKGKLATTPEAIQMIPEPSMNLSPRHKEVVNLLRQGKAITSIAKDTGVGVGEIQLLERLLQQQQGDKQ